MRIDEAAEKFCPFRQDNCVHKVCMLWVVDGPPAAGVGHCSLTSK